MKEYKNVHCIGIGGIGVSAIARFYKLNGSKVAGSDVCGSELINELRNENIEIKIGHKSENISKDCDLIIYSPAITENNPELVRAKELQIETMSYPQMLGEISKTRPTIAVSGMHGKSTTTAMIAKIFESAGLDPFVIVGSKVPGFKYGNIRISQNPNSVFIVEACEYRANMLNIRPLIAVITVLEEEHLDYYSDINHILKTFQEFVDKLPSAGALIRLQRDSREHKLTSRARLITAGIDSGDISSEIMDKTENRTRVRFSCRDNILGWASLRVPGSHNVENASLAVAVANEWGIPHKVICAALSSFKGIWRRFEFIGEIDGISVISDYGHHPTEIKAVLKTAREWYQNKKFLLVYQPHQYDRTAKFKDDFVKVLSNADGLIISDVYDVEGRQTNKIVTSKDLFELILKNKTNNVWYGGNLDETMKKTEEVMRDFDVVIIMGAGSIDSVARKIIKK